MKTRGYLILMATAILIPVLVFSGLGLYLLLKQEREARLRLVEETARATALAIDQEIANAEGALRVLASTNFVHLGDFESLHTLMRAASKSPNAWAVLLDQDGKILAHSLFPFGTNFSHSGYPWVAAVLDQQKPYVSDLRIGANSKVPVVSVSIAVPTATAERRFILNLTFRTSHFKALMAPRGVPDTWIIGMFDSKGNSIARNKDAERLTGKPVRHDLYEESLKAFSGRTRHITRENTAVYSAFTHTARTGWTVAVGVPESEIERAARRAVSYSAVALCLVLALASAGVLILARRLARAASAAEAAARSVGNGKIPQVSPSHVTEFDVLQNALHDAGLALAKENAARRMLEQERERLLDSERQARVLAEEQNRSKDEFLAMLGHELRNPLGAISSALAVMTIAGARADQIKRAQDIAQRQAVHLARIVDDLLDVGRVMAGKIQLTKEDIELGEFVRHCVDSHTIQAGNRRWHLDIQAVWVRADRTRLEQIVGNVLANAIRYTPEDGTIDVSVHPDGEDAEIRIRDNGVGMAPELLPRIFDVLVQGPATLDRPKGGLGLGLALVQRLVALHGGTVSASSPGVGQGSTFVLRLPRSGDDGNSSPAPALPVAAKGQHVMVVEDNPEAREMLVTVLSLHGFRVSSAVNGADALQLVAQDCPAAAIVDIGLPDINGYDLARRLRSNEATCGMRLIALTGYGQEHDRRMAMSAGFDAHLTKPYVVDDLLALFAIEHRNGSQA